MYFVRHAPAVGSRVASVLLGIVLSERGVSLRDFPLLHPIAFGKWNSASRSSISRTTVDLASVVCSPLYSSNGYLEYQKKLR